MAAAQLQQTHWCWCLAKEHGLSGRSRSQAHHWPIRLLLELLLELRLVGHQANG